MNNIVKTTLRRIRSLCPECLRPIDARYMTDGDAVYMEKSCPEHGFFCVPVWVNAPGTPDFSTWKNGNQVGNVPSKPATIRENGCPFDCGLCPEHAQHTCCSLVEVTRRCNMNCPVCYASAGGVSTENTQAHGDAASTQMESHSVIGDCAAHTAVNIDPDLSTIREQLDMLMERAGPANVQLSGGEPTMRDDLPEIINLAHSLGFPFVQLNTNGLRLGREPGYARRLKDAGLNLVYLQWDGLAEETFIAMRGAPYLADKENAARNCVEAGLSVLFVATVARGVNDVELGALLRKALSFGPHVRGLHLQPVALFGRHPWGGHREYGPKSQIVGTAKRHAQPSGANRGTRREVSPRFTLPELMRALEEQSEGMVKASDFHPPSSEHELCSFSSLYQRGADNSLTLLSGGQSCCCASGGEAAKARDFVAQHWGDISPKPIISPPGDGLDVFLAQSNLKQRFTISAMAFQDAYNIDLDRVRRCHIHVATADKRLIPFCSYNLTSADGIPVYR